MKKLLFILFLVSGIALNAQVAGNTDYVVIHTDTNLLISGDTIFPGGAGNTEIPGASRSQILKSIKEKLFPLPGDTVIHPGHGAPSTIERERNSPYYER